MVHIILTDKGMQILGLCPTEWETLGVRINSVCSNKHLGNSDAHSSWTATVIKN